MVRLNGTGLQVYVSVQKVNYTVVFNSNVKEVPWEVTIGGPISRGSGNEGTLKSRIITLN